MLQDRRGSLQDCEVLTPETSSVEGAGRDGLFFANAGGKGYYRSAYAPAQYRALVAHVESGLTPPERISLAGDEWAQVRANKATVGDYLGLVEALKIRFRRRSGFPCTFAALRGDCRSSWPQAKRSATHSAAWIRRNFAPEYARLGAPEPDDSPNKRELRAVLFRLLGRHGNDPEILAQARKIADQYLADPLGRSHPGAGRSGRRGRKRRRRAF